MTIFERIFGHGHLDAWQRRIDAALHRTERREPEGDGDGDHRRLEDGFHVNPLCRTLPCCF